MATDPEEPRLEQQLNELRDKAEDMRNLLDAALLLDREADVDRLAGDAAPARAHSAR